MSFNALSSASLFWKPDGNGYLKNMDVERRTVQNRSSRNRCEKVELGSWDLILVSFSG